MELTRDAILDASDLERVRVELPEWDGHAFVRMLTGAERETFERNADDLAGAGTVRATWIAATVVDGQGQNLFDMNGDIERLNNKASAPLQRLFEAAVRLNEFSQGDIERLEGN